MNKLTRAKFLRLLLTTTTITFSLLSCNKNSWVTINKNKSFSQNIDVIVIGAGISGIISAFDLTQKGLNVIILEGRNRIGGRIWTDKSLNLPIDLGASWIHGKKANPITKLAKNFDIKTLSFDYEDSLIYNWDGKKVDEDDANYYEDLFYQLYKEIESLRRERNFQNQDDISLQQAINKILEGENLDKEETKILDFLLNTYIEHEYAGALDKLSLYYWDQSKYFKGEDLIFPQGYEQIIQPLAQNLNIKLNHIVEKIDWNDNIKITTNQGIFESKYAIITLPLGVLKSGDVKFTPSLPDIKQKAINNLGMGVLNKVILKFSEVFWDNIQVLNYISENKGEWGEFINFDIINQQPILLGFNGGKYAIEIEKYSDDQIVKKVMKILTNIYGNISNPIDIIITRWYQDKFSYGSYSYLKVGATPTDYENLAQPLDNKLFFAGEATSKDYPATIHGAFLSGKRVVNEIVNLI